MNVRKVINGSTLEKDLVLDTDVVIVGSGAGGGFTAEILTNAGFRVVMLEKGGYHTAKNFSQNEAEAFPMLYMDAAAQRTKDKAMVVLQGRTVGGGTTVNWTSSFRTPDLTLNHWADVYGLKGLTPAAMAPHFDAVEQRLNIHKWVETEPNANNKMVAKGCEKLGYSWELISRNVNGCANSGQCGLGCPVNAKQGMLVTTIPTALDKGCVLRHCAEALNIVHDGNRASSVEALAMDALGQTPTGRKIRINAKHVVVAAGGIRSPALLMRSKIPDPAKLTGKRTFLHPVSLLVAKFAEPINPFHGAPQTVYSNHFWLPEGKVFGASRLGYKIEATPLFPVLLAALFDKGMGKSSAEFVKSLPHLQSANALHRDGFNAHEKCGTVELVGDRDVVLDYPIDDFLMNSLTMSMLEIMEIQFAAGAQYAMPYHLDARPVKNMDDARAWVKSVKMEPLRMLAGAAHVMGGCQMGTDANNSVVNEWGQHHVIENLSVFDGSVFPSSIGANPQESIYGMTYKNASALAKNLR